MCGYLCSEITSPLIIYTIKIHKENGEFYIVSEISNYELEFKFPLTKNILKQALINSEYFLGPPKSIGNFYESQKSSSPRR